jgi:hypothetical protein
MNNVELKDRFGLTPGAIVVALAAGTLAGASGAASVITKPAKIDGGVTVYVEQALGQNETAFSLPFLLANYEAAVTSPAAIDEVASTTNIPSGVVSTNLRVVRNGQATTVTVRYTGDTEEQATLVAAEAARAGLSVVADRSLQANTRKKQRLDELVEGYDRRLKTISDRVGNADVVGYLDRLSETTFDLQNQLALQDDEETATLLRRRIEANTKTLREFEADRSTFAEISAEKASIQELLVTTNAALELDQLRLDAAKDGTEIRQLPSAPQGRMTAVARAFLGGFLVVTALVGGLLTLLRRRVVRRREMKAAEKATTVEMAAA